MRDDSTLYERLMKVKPLGVTENAWAKDAGVNRSVWQDIKKRGRARHDTIEKLLDAVGVSWAEFDAGAAPTRPARPDDPAASAFHDPVRPFRAQTRPRDVPVLGTASCADLRFDSETGEIVDVEALQIDLDEVVDWLGRPLALDGRPDVYGIYFTGTSMLDRFEPGEPAYVDAKRMPKASEYAVVQLAGADGDGEHRVIAAIAKRVVRMSPTFIELEQLNPRLRFRVPRDRVAAIHRIIPWGELTSF